MWSGKNHIDVKKTLYIIFICCYRFRSKTIKIILGKTNLNSEGTTVLAKSIIAYPDFKKNDALNNLAIVEITKVQISRECKRY